MTIPSDVAALQSQRPLHQHLQLQYGQVQHVALEFGVAYDICVRRIDAAGQRAGHLRHPVYLTACSIARLSVTSC